MALLGDQVKSPIRIKSGVVWEAVLGKKYVFQSDSLFRIISRALRLSFLLILSLPTRLSAYNFEDNSQPPPRFYSNHRIVAILAILRNYRIPISSK